MTTFGWPEALFLFRAAIKLKLKTRFGLKYISIEIP